ncbi:MAG: hypothetical protein ACLFUB_13645 [Cyclobacteriaceae bacterium]
MLLQKSHHSVGAWQVMLVSSINGFILKKQLRLKQVEDDQGKLLVS